MKQTKIQTKRTERIVEAISVEARKTTLEMEFFRLNLLRVCVCVIEKKQFSHQKTE